MKQAFFAVDLGATSGRTILGHFSSSGLVLEEVNRFPNHLIEVRGHFYWDIYELYRNVVDGLRRVARRRDCELVSIGIDTWGVDFVCLGKDGTFLRQPYSYRDPQTQGAADALFERMSRSRVYERTGIQVMDFNTLFQLDVLRRRGDVALGAAHKLLFIPDALVYMLTGEVVTEYTVASTSQLLDARTRRFAPELLELVGLREEHFGRLVFPGEQVGTLSPEVQRMTGLGAIPVVAVGEHDTASAVAAVPAAGRNFAYLSSGTWSLMGVEVEAPVLSREAEGLNFTNEGGVGGTIRLLKNIAGMWLLERCLLAWPGVSYETLIAEAGASEAFRSIVNPDDASFAHPSDMIQAIRHFCALRQQSVPETRGQLVRCIFESLALRYRHVLHNLQAFAPHPVEVLHVIGGGSRNELLNQWTADAVGLPVVAGPSEATAVGNMMVQAIAAGKGRDVPAMRELLRHSLPLKTYYPKDTAAWAAAGAAFPFL